MAIATSNSPQAKAPAKVFVPFCDAMFDARELPGVLVPFDREFTCVRLADGTYDFTGEARDVETA